MFHEPYNKLVEKSFARLYLCDAQRRYALNNNTVDVRDKDLTPWLTGAKPTSGDRDLEKVLKAKSKEAFKVKLEASNEVSKMVRVIVFIFLAMKIH